MLTPGRIRTVLAEHHKAPSKALGQHFLADPNTSRKIARLTECGATDRIFEIGPGIGSLTLALCELGASVVALELDQYAIPALEHVLTEDGFRDAVRIVHGDALDVDFAALLGDDEYCVASNLPYNVATPIVMRLLEEAPNITSMVVMVQREVAERWVAAVDTRAYGAVTVKLNYFATARIVGQVARSVFIPPPNVDSSLVRIVRRPEPAVAVADEAQFFTLVRAGFAQRRKTLGRALRAVLGDDAPAVCTAAGIDPRARAETLTLTQWAALYAYAATPMSQRTASQRSQ